MSEPTSSLLMKNPDLPFFFLIYLFLTVLDHCCCSGFSLSRRTDFPRGGFSCCGAQALRRPGFSSDGIWAQ